MSNAIDPTSAFAGANGGTFVSGPEKNELFITQEGMYVVHAEGKSDGVYGEQTVFHVKAKPWGRDEVRLLAFKHTEHRQRVAENMLLLLAANPGGFVGPVYLHKFTSKSGNEGWELKPTPFEGPKTPIAMPNAASTPATPQPVAAVQTTDDDLPF